MKKTELIKHQYVIALEDFNRAVDAGCPADIHATSRAMLRWQQALEALTALKRIRKYVKRSCRACGPLCDLRCPLGDIKHELTRLEIECKPCRIM